MIDIEKNNGLLSKEDISKIKENNDDVDKHFIDFSEVISKEDFDNKEEYKSK